MVNSRNPEAVASKASPLIPKIDPLANTEPFGAFAMARGIFRDLCKGINPNSAKNSYPIPKKIRA